MLHFLQTFAPLFFQLAIPPLGLFIASRIKKPTDQQKAQHLAQIANDAAALAVSQSKGAPWATLLRDVVRAITNAAGVPTSNAEAIERAAAAALSAQGVKLPS